MYTQELKVAPVATVDAATAAAYGPIYLVTRSHRADLMDKLIAARVIAVGVTRVTNKVDYFKHSPRVVIQNWICTARAFMHTGKNIFDPS